MAETRGISIRFRSELRFEVTFWPEDKWFVVEVFTVIYTNYRGYKPMWRWSFDDPLTYVHEDN